ncbi:phasin family protein [Pilimelia columellifera]|uniref:Polyhydroxyalkanoate synthesis regulator phasin n=1 Tax=Pilimelia columellifera subsp. columellifera TaxID=706583 RepID=A0ABP6B3E3_9ACTN
MQDTWRAYVELLTGVTEASRKRAQDLVARAVGVGGATAVQAQAISEEIISAAVSSRGALLTTIRGEVEGALGRMGLAGADDVDALSRRVDRLESQVAQLRVEAATAAGAATVVRSSTPTVGSAAAPAARPVVKKAVRKAAKKATPAGGASPGGTAAPAQGGPSSGAPSPAADGATSVKGSGA